MTKDQVLTIFLIVEVLVIVVGFSLAFWRKQIQQIWRTSSMQLARKVLLRTGIALSALALIAEEYHIGVLRKFTARIGGWLFAWVWEVPGLISFSPSRIFSVIGWMLLVTLILSGYYVLGTLATGTIVGIARRCGFNPARDTQISFLIFWPPVLLAMLIVGWTKGTMHLLRPIGKMLYEQGVQGVDRSVETVTGKSEALVRRGDYIDQPVSLFDPEPKDVPIRAHYHSDDNF